MMKVSLSEPEGARMGDGESEGSEDSTNNDSYLDDSDDDIDNDASDRHANNPRRGAT